jgi:glycosyltransferase involved in cell wall biosynthesis
MNNLISVIIPAYNHSGTLERCFVSVIAQSYRSIEVIIVNDGSTDGFDTVADKILAGMKRPDVNVVIINQQNQGAPAARNRGFAASKGEFIIFWDADTVAEPGMLAKMKASLDNNSGASYAYSSFKFGWKKFSCRAFNAEELRRNNFIDVTSLIRRADFPGFDETVKRFQDWDLWLTMLEKNKTGVFVPETLYRKIVGGRAGISRWLPRFFYRLPWATKEVRRYREARRLVSEKHGLTRQ